MKRRSICFALLLFCVIFICTAFTVSAEENCTLTLTYTKDNIVFSALEINIYRISDTDFVKLSPYDTYPVNIVGITSQTEWSETASTLGGYIAADGIEPYMTAVTDDGGTAVFGGIERGLYLVMGVASEREGKIFTFYDFMITVTEDVTAKPKSGIEVSSDEEKEYTVTKLWKDGGSTDRPASVTVDVILDGSHHETVVLDASNNWSCSFTVDSNVEVDVAERGVGADYSVLVTENEASIIIVNVLTDDDDKNPNDDDTDSSGDESTEYPDDSYDDPGFDTLDGPVSDTDEKSGTTKPTDKGTSTKPTSKPSNKPSAPQTGDTAPIKLYIVICCISGLLLVVLGIGMRRREDA